MGFVGSVGGADVAKVLDSSKPWGNSGSQRIVSWYVPSMDSACLPYRLEIVLRRSSKEPCPWMEPSLPEAIHSMTITGFPTVKKSECPCVDVVGSAEGSEVIWRYSCEKVVGVEYVDPAIRSCMFRGYSPESRSKVRLVPSPKSTSIHVLFIFASSDHLRYIRFTS